MHSTRAAGHASQRMTALAVLLCIVVAVSVQAPSAEAATTDKPWGGSMTEVNQWGGYQSGWLMWLYGNDMASPQFTCGGTETVTVATNGNGVKEPPLYRSPITVSASHTETCSGSYWVGNPGVECFASATLSGSGSTNVGLNSTDEGQQGLYVQWIPYPWPSAEHYWSFEGGTEAWGPADSVSLDDPCGYLIAEPHPGSVIAGVGARNEPVPGIPEEQLTPGTRIYGSNDYAESAGSQWRSKNDTWDFYYRGLPPCPTAPSATTGDKDGDGLPNRYESSLGTDPLRWDTDNDCHSDRIEVASGSSPFHKAQTPDNLPNGRSPANVTGSGAAGITCGDTAFRWVTPSLDNLGVGTGKNGCILLLSNSTANAVLDYSIEYGPSITKALVLLTKPYLQEIYGRQAVNWAHDQVVNAQIWGAKAIVKRALLKSLNLTRLNGVFTIGRLVGLSGVPLGAFWALNQVRNKNACVQVRIGNADDGGTALSWSLVYSAENLTSAGLSDDLHRAGAWKKKVRDNAPDVAERKSTNLYCRDGVVRASGASASAVFSNATSFIF